jgi:hypothetical protein
MKQIESKSANLRLVSSRGKAVNAPEGSISLFYKPAFNEMLDLESNCFLHLVEEHPLFKMHDWEGERTGKDPVS